MALDTLTISAGCPTSSLDKPGPVIFLWPDPNERRSTSTVGGDYRPQRIADDDHEEARQWAEITRRAQERWAKDNPY